MTEAGSLVTGWSDAAQAAAPSTARSSPLRRSGVLALAGAGLWLARGPAPAGGPSDGVADGRRVVVLPFRDLSAQPSGPLIGEGFAETVSTLLASGGGVAVLPPAPWRADGRPGLRWSCSDGRAGRRPRLAAVPGGPRARHVGRPRTRRPAGLVGPCGGLHGSAARPPGRRRPADGRGPRRAAAVPADARRRARVRRGPLPPGARPPPALRERGRGRCRDEDPRGARGVGERSRPRWRVPTSPSARSRASDPGPSARSRRAAARPGSSPPSDP